MYMQTLAPCMFVKQINENLHWKIVWGYRHSSHPHAEGQIVISRLEASSDCKVQTYNCDVEGGCKSPDKL